MKSFDKSTFEELRRIASQVDALKRGMEMTLNLSTEDHGKWNGFANYARTYSRLAASYRRLTGYDDVSVYNIEKLPSWSSIVWPQAKNLFEQVYSDTLILASVLNEFSPARSTSQSEVQDLLAVNLRRAVFDKPSLEKDIQNSVESLFIGRGYQKGFDYDRETGRVKFSGKEFIPDFVFPSFGMAIEVKLIREKNQISKCVEEISADIPAYLSTYDSILFCVYDLGCIQDVSEFAKGFENQAGVRVCVVKH